MNVLKKHLISRVLSIALSVLMALTNPMAAYAAEDGYVPEDEYAEQIEQLRSEVTFVIEDENPDKNVSSIPEDEELPEGGTNEEVDKPPKVEDSPGDTETPDPNGDGKPAISPEVTPETTPEVTPEITPETTPEVTPSEDPDPPTPTEEVKEPEPTEEPSPTPIVLIEFDHYYSEITESAVNTPELMIKTSNPDVFTKNTNVISNYDDVYIIECASVQEARYVYSYYINKVDFISDLSEVMTLASDGEEKHEDDVADLENLNESEDAISQLNEIVPEVQKVDYSNYIALIDTGANADVNFSVVGENTADDNGHGTRMLELIKSANPNAKVMSIKVFNGSTTTVADVYAGIKLAIESDVKVINLSLVGANIQKNAILKEIIQEALDKGIIVIGAAGNNNTNAKNYIPGCIDGVIVVGAVNEDGSKYSTSNYNASVYVVATSTSEATAIYTGLYTADRLDDGRIFTALKDPNENQPIDEPIEIPSDTQFKTIEEFYKYYFPEYDVTFGEDGEVYLKLKNSGDSEIKLAAPSPQNLGLTTEDFKSVTVGTTYTGTCRIYGNTSTGYGGDGYTIRFDEDVTNKNMFYKIWVGAGRDSILATCDSQWNNATQSRHALTLHTTDNINNATQVYYQARVTDKTSTRITFEILFSSSSSNFGTRTWTPVTDNYDWIIQDAITGTGSPYQISTQYGNSTVTPYYHSIRYKINNGDWVDAYTYTYNSGDPNGGNILAGVYANYDSIVANVITKLKSNIPDVDEIRFNGKRGYNGGESVRATGTLPSTSNIRFTNGHYITSATNTINLFSESVNSTTRYSLSYETCSERQIYRAQAYADNIGSLKITKNVSPAPQTSKDFYFYITGPNGYTNRVTISVSSTGTATSATISDLVPGSYTVMEVASSTSTTPVGDSFDYEVSPSASITKDIPSGGDPIEFVFDNTENASTYLKITKAVNSNCIAIVNGNTYYTLNGTQIAVYSNSACTTLMKTKDGSDAIFTITATNGSTASIDKTLEFDYNNWKGQTVYVKELKSGRGYKLNSTPVSVQLSNTKGATVTATVTNTPNVDPLNMSFRKVSSKTGQSFSGTISAQGARYTLEYYPLTGTTNLNNPSSVSHASSPSRTWVFQVGADNKIRFDDASYKVSGNDLFTDPSDSTLAVYPNGYYRLYESSAPTGLLIDPAIYEIYYLPNTSDGTNIAEDTSRYIYVSGSNVSGFSTRQLIYSRVVDTNGTVQNAYTNPNYKIGNIALISADGWAAAEPEEWATMRIQKVDSVTGTTPQGDLSLGGAVFRLYCTNAVNLAGSDFTKGTTGITTLQTADGKTVSFGTTVYPVLLNGSQYTITTNASGLATTGTRLLPYSANGYYLVEYSAPAGYYTDGVAHNVTSWTSTTSGGTTTYIAQASDAKEPRIPYPIEGWKNDAGTGSTPQGNASLNGIRFAVVNTSANSVVVGGTTIGVNRVVGVMTTTTHNGRQGYFSMDGLPVGKYQIVELRVGATAPVNGTITQGTNTMANDYYLFSANTINVTIASNGTVTYSPTNATVSDTPKSIGISITKTDTEGNSVSTLSLAGIRYAIVNRGTNAIRYNNTNYSSGVVVAILTINASGTASITGLPYSDYDVYELRSNATIAVGETYNGSTKLGDSVKANNTYLWTNVVRNVRPVASTANGASFSVSYENPPIRADFSFIKYGGTTSTRLSYIPFLVTNTDTGEQHVIITDANGLINTKTRTRTASSMNRLDGGLSANGTTYTGAMDATAASYNIWFGSTNGIAANRGVLVPGHYTVQELRCSRNQGYALITFSFLFSPTASGAQLVNNGDLYEVNSDITINPEMSFETNVVDVGTGTKELTVGSSVVIRDTITAHNLMRSRTYSYTTTIVVTDFSGNYKRTIKAESAKTNFPSGTDEFYDTTVTANITVDTSSVVAGEKVCVVTKIYEAEYQANSSLLVTHNANYLDANEWLYNIDYPIQITKSIPNKYNSIVNGNPNYSLNGVTFYVYTDANCTTRAVDKRGNPISIVLTADAGSMATITSNKVILNKYHGQKLYAKEVVSGDGFKLSTDVKEVTVPTQANLTADTLLTFTFDNEPMYDVPSILQKVSDKSGSSDFDGNVLVANAEYTVTFRYEENSSVIRTWVYKTDSTGKIDFSKDTNKVSGTTYKDPNDNTTNVWPLGYYTITETKTAENASGNKTGVALDTATYQIRLYKAADNQHVNRTVTKNGTTVFQRTYASNGTITNNSSATINGTNTPLYISNSETLNSIETEVWAPIGVLKADNWYWTQNSADNILKLPEGNASYEGAQYLVLVNGSISNADRDTFFNTTRSNPNGSKVLTLGTAITSVDIVDGVGTAGTTNLNGNYYPVLVDGQRLIITTNANGYGETSVKLPYSGMYRLIEIKAPEGYNVDRTIRSISNVWYDSDLNLLGVDDYDGTHHDVVIVPGTATSRAGAVPEKVLVYSLEGYKVDANTKTTNSATGDASLNGIKYAIINRSDNAIVIDSADYQSNSHIQTATNVRFNVGEVVAIVTTYRNNNKDGYWTMNGLPYGKYEVVELRSDNTVALHDVFDNLTSEKLGASVTANASYMYTDTRDSSEILAYNQYFVESLIITVNGDSTPANNTTVSSTYTGDRVVSYNNGIYTVERAFKNYPVRGSIQVIKKDYETTDGTPQGINSLAGIKYAVVNRSTQSVYVIGYGVVATGKVVAILTTNEDGEVITPNMTYGTYDIYELRQDATIAVGDTYDGSAKLGTSNYVNDYYLYCDDMAKLTVNNPEYSVEEKREVYHITPGQTVTDTFLNPSKRGGEFIFKFDMGGHRMPYIPFVLMLVEAEADGTPIKDANGNYTVIEQHTIIGDANGVIRSDRNPTSSTINTLDSYYNQATGYYTGPLDSTASAVPIWFGSTNYVNRYRGALIPGTYVLQELRADTNYGYAMSSISFRITEDHEMVYPEDAVVNPKINITSIAWDVNSQSDVLTVGTSVQLRDTVQFINLKYADTYGYKTVIYITDDAGNILDDSFYTSPIKQLDLGARPNPTDEVCTLCEDVQIITVNTSTLEKGKTVNMVVELYQKINNNWTENPIAAHNTNADVDKQKLIIPDISTEAVNKTTGSRLASLDGKTIADDKIVYTNFGNEHTWLITGKLVDDAGNVIKDVNGNACQIIPISLYTSKANTTITVNGTINVAGMLMKSVSGPISGEFTLSQLGLGDFELPNHTYENAHFVVAVINTANSQEVLSHNADLDVEDEVIRYMQLNTVASSSDDLQGVLPNSTSATLKDTLNYSNLVENTAVKVVGKVYEVKVVDGVKTVDLANPITTKTVSETWTKGSGTKVMTFTFDSTPYAGKDLVVYEYVYTTISGTDVLIGEHALADDAMQTVSIPKISTFMYVRHKDSNDDYTLYKMVSRRIESVELRDIVSFENLNTNYYWTFIGTLMDKTAQAPVKDKSGNNVTTTVTFKPATKDGKHAVNYIFNQDIADIEWDDINWYVSFEEVHSGEAGHTTLVYTEHKDYDDARQTVNVPSLRTTAKSNDTTHVKQIVGKPDQVVTDTIEFNNFNKYASAGDTFTIKMEALYEDGSAVMNGTNPYVVTKTITWNGQTSENISMTLDGTPLIGKTIVFKETIYYGESTNAVDELMVENALTHVEEMITVPEIKTTALDSETNSETVSLTRVIVDTLELNRILPDTDFVITTKVFDKDANAFLKNNDGTDFVVTTNYHSPATSTNNLVCEHCGKVYAVDDTTTINIDLSAIDGLDGKTLVVYEYMLYQNNFYAEHVNKDDVNQTVKVPEIKTMFLNTETGTHVAALGTTVEVVDTVTYKNLISGEAYTMTCKLIDKNSETVFDTKTETFTADASGNGTVEIKFTIDTTTLEGKRLVAYETCAVGGVDIAKHEDLNDEDQTVRVPVLRTTLIDVVIDDHMTAYNTSEVLKDTVTYGNLQEGLTYKMVGTLYNKETETSLGITAEKEFKAGTDGAGSVEMTFTVDSVALAGIHIVAFEDVYFEAVKVGTHSSMDDDNQTVGVPDIKTVFTDPLVDIANTSYGESITVNDKVSYVNLLPLHEYKIVGILMDKATNAPVLDKEGKEITVEKKFTPTEPNGNETVSFTIDTEFLKGKVLVAFEELYYIEKDVVVARHHNINDVDQTLYIPEIKTTLVSVDTDEHIVPVVDADVVLEDTVTYKNLIPGEEYVLKGVLIDKKTGNPVEIDGHKIEGTTPFTPTSAEGSEVVTFTFNSLALKGTTVVAFEELYHNDVLITIHADVDDENQTVDIPDIKTSFFDTDLETTVIDGEVRSGQVKPSVTLKDIVTYTNLNPAYEYTVTGTLMYKDGSKVLVDGNPITASTTFTPSDRTGTVEVVFENINTELLAGQTIVAFETLTRKTIEIVTHADLEDKDQTIKVPEIGTTLVDKLTQENVVVVGKNVELVDSVAFKNLIVGKTYTLNGTLYNKATGEAIKDSEDKLITATTTFVAETEDGTVDVVFKFNTDEFTGETLVAFETLLYNGIEIETHANIDDESQTVYVPEIGTTLYDAEFTEDDDVVTYRETVTLVDIVEYKNLVPEKEYTLNGTIMDKATGKALVGKDGKEIIASVTFKPETANGTVNVEFEIDSTILPNTTLVAFETLVYNGVDVLVHADIDDVAQTVRIPEIHTTATDVYTEEHVGVVTETTKIVDVVEYTNLIPDKEYTVIGTLVDKETGDAIKDAEDKEITKTVKFTVEKPEGYTDGDGVDGTVEVIFDVDSTLLRGKTVVVFEDLYYKDKEVAIHMDIDDENQTVQYPDVKTLLISVDTEDHIVPSTGKVKVVDTVSYTNLLIGKEYVVTGKLIDKDTNKALTNEDSTEVIGTTTFTPTTTDGNVKVEFEIDATVLTDKTYVAFESLTFNDIVVVTHEDIDDELQTVYIPELHTTARDKADDDKILDGTQTEQTIVDAVECRNLIVGKEYTIIGKLAVKREYAEGEDLEYVVDADGNIITSEVTFVAEESDCVLEVEFTFDASKYAGNEIVVFESIYFNNVEIATHADIEDENQTVDISLFLHVKIAKVDHDNIKYVLRGAEITIFDEEGNIVLDIDGNECIGVTDETGMVDFTILYDRNKTYYAKETKAPEGFNICDDLFEVTPSSNRDEDEESGVCLIPLQIRDRRIVIPPKTGDDKPIGLAIILFLIGILCVGAFFAYKIKFSGKPEEDEEYNAEEDNDELISALNIDDIDGDAIVSNDIKPPIDS